MASLAMLIPWEIWKESNVCAFWNNTSTLTMIIAKIKEEVKLWSLARARALSIVIPPE
jgi:hypothetical protein